MIRGSMLLLLLFIFSLSESSCHSSPVLCPSVDINIISCFYIWQLKYLSVYFCFKMLFFIIVFRPVKEIGRNAGDSTQSWMSKAVYWIYLVIYNHLWVTGSVIAADKWTSRYRNAFSHQNWCNCPAHHTSSGSRWSQWSKVSRDSTLFCFKICLVCKELSFYDLSGCLVDYIKSKKSVLPEPRELIGLRWSPLL